MISRVWRSTKLKGFSWRVIAGEEEEFRKALPN
jgi:hypothetical protein